MSKGYDWEAGRNSQERREWGSSSGDTQGVSPHLLGLKHGIEGLQRDEVL